MRSSHSRSFAFALAVSALVPSLLAAQAPPAQRPAPRIRAAAPAPRATGPENAPFGPGAGVNGPGARAGRGGGRGGGHPAAMLLRARTQLELTDDQVTRLEAMQAAPAPKSNATDMMRAQADLLDATHGDGNIAGARAALDKLSRLRNDQMLARIKTQQDVRAVLTSSQKTKVDNMRQQLRSRAGATRQRGLRQRGLRQRGLRQGGMRQGGMRQGRQGQAGRGGQGFRGGPPMGGQMGPGMMPRNPQRPQGGPQGPMPRPRRGGDAMDQAPPVPPAN